MGFVRNKSFQSYFRIARTAPQLGLSAFFFDKNNVSVRIPVRYLNPNLNINIWQTTSQGHLNAGEAQSSKELGFLGPKRLPFPS